MNLGRAGVLLERFGVQKVFSRAESSGVKQKILSRDGYRLTKDNFTDTYTLDVNKTESHLWKEKVKRAMLGKARVRLGPRERVHLDRVEPENPNQEFIDKKNLPTYGSLDTYAAAADKERLRQLAEGVHWNTADKHLQDLSDKTVYTDIGEQPVKRKKISAKAGAGDKKSLERTALKKQIFENRVKLEYQARHRILQLDEQGLTDAWEDTEVGINSINAVFHHYGLFKHLYNDKHFYNRRKFDVGYACVDDADDFNPVYYGNDLTPTDTTSQPLVAWESQPEELFTLKLVNLDGNMMRTGRESLQWMVANIKGDDISSGDVIADYLKPLPMRGTGYHRMAFILLKQKSPMNFSNIQRDLTKVSLQERCFSNKNFMKRYKKHLVPVAMKFYQTIWDDSVMEKFHELGVDEPVYLYDVPPLMTTNLRRFPAPGRHKTLTWLKNFMPDEPIFPGGGRYD